MIKLLVDHLKMLNQQKRLQLLRVNFLANVTSDQICLVQTEREQKCKQDFGTSVIKMTPANENLWQIYNDDYSFRWF